MIADDFSFLAILGRKENKKFLLASWKSFTNSSSNPLQRTCCGIPKAVSDSKNVSKAPYRILKNFRKAVVTCIVHTWENRPMREKESRNRNSNGACRTIFKIRRWLHKSKQEFFIHFFLLTRQHKNIKTICDCPDIQNLNNIHLMTQSL